MTFNRNHFIIFLFAVVSAFSAAAAEKVVFKAAAGTAWVAPKNKLKVAGDGSLKLALPASIRLHEKEEFKIDPARRYTLICEVRCSGTDSLNIGIFARTADGRPLNSLAVRRRSAALGETIRAVRAEDTSLLLKGDLTDWAVKHKRSKHSLVPVFGAKPDSSDLPNFNISKGAVKDNGIRLTENGCWQIDLKQPCGLNYPAGTAVALHHHGQSFPYAKIPPCRDKWRIVQDTFSFAAGRTNGMTPFLTGSDRAGLIIFSRSGGTAEIRNLVIIED